MKKFLLLALLLGLPSPLFALPTDGYKKMEVCYFPNSPKQARKYKHSVWKKEHTKSKKWGSYACVYDPKFRKSVYCKWQTKAVSYDEANKNYQYLCRQTPKNLLRKSG